MREFDLSNARWRKSSYSGGTGGEACVEVADGIQGAVPIRDSKAAPHGPVVTVGAAAWAAFVGAMRN